MTTLHVDPAPAGLRARLRVPGDKSISHRALLLAALASGTSQIEGLSTGDDVARTAAALSSMGATITPTPKTTTVLGGSLREPPTTLYIGNSGTSIRLLAGLCAGLPGLYVLAGDESIASRPMGRVAAPLRLMGAHIDGRQDGELAPLVVRGGNLRGIDYTLPMASAQVKAAVLLAGLSAEGATTVHESLPTRMHTEEMLASTGAEVSIGSGWVTVKPSRPSPFALTVPGDPSKAAIRVVAACLVPGSEVRVDDVYLGPSRNGFLDVLARMGADVEVHPTGERRGDILARHSALRATEVESAEVPGLIDEIPVLAVAAAYAEGTSTFRGVGELRHKESDRLTSVASELSAIGGQVETTTDSLVIHGSAARPLRGGHVDSHGDHRVAMSMAVAGLAAAGPVSVEGWEAVATSYPTFEEDLRKCLSRP
ncbi:MAG: 3-phosphoshikimate 1-carboxyvinyltransferase [Acidimicrobiales bacterium]